MLALNIFLLLNLLAFVYCQSLNVAGIDVQWTNNGASTEFVLKSSAVDKTNSWFGIGFGKGMNYVNTVICKGPPFNDVNHHYNGFFSSEPLVQSNPRIGIFNATVSIVDNLAVCKFTRENSNSAKDYYKIDSERATNIIGAYGSVKSDGTIEYHKKTGNPNNLFTFPTVSNFLSATSSNLAATIKTTTQSNEIVLSLPEITFPPFKTPGFPSFTSNFFQNLLNNIFAMPPSKKSSSDVKGFLQFLNLKPGYVDFLLDQVSSEQLKAFLSVGETQFEGIEVKSLATLSFDEKVSFYKDLSVVQNFMASLKASNLNKILSAVKPEVVNKLMVSPDFMKYASSVLKF